jgi:hypothetical protein
MMWRRMQSTVGVLVLGGALTLGPVAVSSATTHKPAKHKVVKKKQSSAKTKAASCTNLNGYQTKSSNFATGLAQAFESGNVTSIKQALVTELNTLNQAITAAESQTKSSSPANVKAAFTTISNVFKQLATAVQNAQTLPEIETALQGIGNNPNLKSASETLGAYYDSYCGITTTTST